MWIALACGSAAFAGLTAILAKCGIRRVDSNLATALRTVVVLAFAWLMVYVTGAQRGLAALDMRSAALLALSGVATGASWLCYFRALQLGDVSRVTPIDKSSTVLTILLATLLLGEEISIANALGIALIGVGTLMMVGRPAAQAAGGCDGRSDGAADGGAADVAQPARAGRWLLYAVLSAAFASAQAILAKLGITGVDSTLGTALRAVVVLAMAWAMVFVTGAQRQLRGIDARSWAFLALSGVATGASWLCYYAALQRGPAGAVVAIDKLSILLTIAFARIVLGERLSRRGALGLGMVTAGTLAMLF